MLAQYSVQVMDILMVGTQCPVQVLFLQFPPDNEPSVAFDGIRIVSTARQMWLDRYERL